jgi:uncharacterized protein YoxC
MTTILLSIITLACVVLVVVLIYVLLELRQATRKLEHFISTTESSLMPTLDELPGTIKSIRHIAENIATVTDDVKTLTGSVREVGEKANKWVHREHRIFVFSTSVRAKGWHKGRLQCPGK